MVVGAPKARIAACLLFLITHAVVILADPTPGELLNYPFLIAAPLIALVAIRRLARGSASVVRVTWTLLGIALAIWTTGAIAAAWADIVLRSSPMVADLSDVLYLSYGIAVIAALALPDRPALLRRLAWIDVAQGLLAFLLCYVVVYSVLPFSMHHTLAIPVGRVTQLFATENGALVVIAGLRVLGRSRRPSRAAFDHAALWFLALYAAGTAIYNHLAVQDGFSPGLASLLPDLPFLLLVLLRPAGPDPVPLVVGKRRPLTLLVDGATPAFFTLLLLWLSIVVTQTRPVLGVITMLLSLMLLLARSTVTEIHHLQVQDALALARDRQLRLARHDDLTGIANRRAFQAALEEHWGDAASPLSLLLLDIDYFKAINDRLGHEAGDTCLRMVAETLCRSLDQPDGTVFRYGGEEFAVLLPGLLPGEARRTAERLRTAISAMAIPNRTEAGDRITVSVGVASSAHGYADPAQLVSGADQALYQAKARGRNLVCADAA